MQRQKAEATIEVPAKDPKRPDKDKEEDDQKATVPILEPEPEPTKSSKKAKQDEREMSAEDEALKAKLTELVASALNTDYAKIGSAALAALKTVIRDATASMTSVPKPLKFLKEHYPQIKAFVTTLAASPSSASSPAMLSAYNDLMSVLAMTMEEPSTRLCLRYRLESDIDSMPEWGTQYLKHVAAEIRIEMETRLAAEHDAEKTADLIETSEISRVVDVVVSYYMANNSEADAIDLLLEVESKELISKYCQRHNHQRVTQYLRACASFLPPPDDLQIYRICFDLCVRFGSYYDAVRFALKLDDEKLVRNVMRLLKDKPLMKRQCAYLLGWHQYMGYDDEESDNEDEEDGDMVMVEKPIEADQENDTIEDYETAFAAILADEEASEEIPDINEIIGNHQLSEAFHSLARDLDVLAPKDAVQDIFKEQLLEETASDTQVVSAKKSLAISVVNGFVHCGFGQDKLMVSSTSDEHIEAADKWIAQNKEKGQLAAVASIGCTMLWDEEAANMVDRYFESKSPSIRAGAYLAIGVSCSGMKSESGMGLALLSAPALNEDGKMTKVERLCAILGLGLSYAGQGLGGTEEAEQVLACLGQLISTEENDEISSLSALCLGFVFVGSCNAEICNIILADLMEREPASLCSPLYLLNVLGLSLLFLGKQEEVDVTMEAMEVFDELNDKFSKTCKVCLECLAYAGTGNVLKIQKMLGILGEHFGEADAEEKEEKAKAEKEKSGKGKKKGEAKEEEDEEEEKEVTDDYRYFQSIATIGISLIAFGEELGSTMSLRMFNHLIQYGSLRVKRAVPLALAMLSVSNPQLVISDTLSKLSHHDDAYVSQNAIMSLGLIGAGTNNARIARMLRALTTYYAKDGDHLHVIRVAQGLTHLGKGLLTLKCFHSDRFLLNKSALCGILTVLFSQIGTKLPAADKENAPSWSGTNPISFLSDFHFLIFSLTLCIKPRMLISLQHETLKPFAAAVRVGQALDTVGAAGKNPKRITGFQTHDTPILLQYKDRAELANDQFVSVASVLEGFAILRPNPESEELKRKRKRELKALKAKEEETAAAAVAVGGAKAEQ